LRGTCGENGCAHAGKGHDYCSPKQKIEKNNRFYALSKLPKEKKSSLPILNQVRVVVENNKMTCVMAELGESIEFTKLEFPSVSGSCNICVPRDMFVDILQMLDKEPFTITEDLSRMTMHIESENFKNSIRGMNAQEFPGTGEQL